MVKRATEYLFELWERTVRPFFISWNKVKHHKWVHGIDCRIELCAFGFASFTCGHWQTFVVFVFLCVCSFWYLFVFDSSSIAIHPPLYSAYSLNIVKHIYSSLFPYTSLFLLDYLPYFQTTLSFNVTTIHNIYLLPYKRLFSLIRKQQSCSYSYTIYSLYYAIFISIIICVFDIAANRKIGILWSRIYFTSKRIDCYA